MAERIAWLGLCLVWASPLWSAPPDLSAPRMSSAARRLIGADDVVFDGRSSPIGDGPRDIDLGTHDFTVGLSLHTDENLRHDLGDLVSLWDPATR